MSVRRHEPSLSQGRKQHVKVQFPIRTRQSERDQLASHLAATISYLWFKALVSILLGSMLSVSMLAGTRTSLSRAVSRAARIPLRVVST